MITDVNKIKFKKYNNVNKFTPITGVTDIELLEKFRIYYDSMSEWRKERLRAKKFHRGDQWSDIIEDNNGNIQKEEDVLMNRGTLPIKQNMIRSMVKSLIGLYLQNPTQSIVIARHRDKQKQAEVMSNALQYVDQINNSVILDSKALYEFAISGMICMKQIKKWMPDYNRYDIYKQLINPMRLVFNTDIQDPRYNDLRIIGEIIDTSIEDIIAQFAKTSQDVENIKSWYNDWRETYQSRQGLSVNNNDTLNFYSVQPGLCRLYEIWQLKIEWGRFIHDPADGTYFRTEMSVNDINAINNERLKVGQSKGVEASDIPLLRLITKPEQYWYVKYLTPNGYVLKESRSPYKHESHPYTLLLHPFIDGEVWGFVSDIIDQQKYLNRIIILIDMIMATSAKGTLMIPIDVIPDGYTPEDFADSYRQIGGVIVYKPSTKHGQVPSAITTNSVPSGMFEMAQLQLKFISDISGVHSALQGQTARSGTPASLYAQESQNAATNLVDHLRAFSDWKSRCDNKTLKLIMQYYDTPRYLAIGGRDYDENARFYDPKEINNVDFDSVISHVPNTAVFRQLAEDTLLNLLDRQIIDGEMYLQNTTLPFADKLLSTLQKKKEALQQGNHNPLPEEAQLQQMVAQNADPRMQQILNKL